MSVYDSFALIQRGAFFSLVIGATLAFVWLLHDFAVPILWALALAVLFHPISRLLTRKLKNSTVAAMLTIIGVLVVVLLPLWGIGSLITREALVLYQRIGSADTAELLYRVEMLPVTQYVAAALGTDSTNLRESALQAARTAASWLAGQALSIGGSAASIVIKTFVMLYLLFVLLKDGHYIGARVMAALPLGDDKEQHLFDRFTSVTRALFRGTIIVALAQGLAGGIIFAIAGVPHALTWGVVMAFLALIPAAGPAIVWLPAGIIMFMLGDNLGAIIVLVGGTVIVGLLDNVLRPVLIGQDTKMPDALVLLSIIGGLSVFGASGLIVGPIIAALFLASWGMFVEEYRPALVERG